MKDSSTDDMQDAQEHIRQPVAHDSAVGHVSGTAKYIDDLAMPANTLELLIAQSPHAHARILDMDLDAVRAADGVVKVLSAQDIPGINDCSPLAGDDPVFAEDIVSYAGQSIFAIAATDMASARAALAHARISYEPF